MEVTLIKNSFYTIDDKTLREYISEVDDAEELSFDDFIDWLDGSYGIEEFEDSYEYVWESQGKEITDTVFHKVLEEIKKE